MQAGLNELISDTWKKLVALAGNSKIKVTVPPSMCEDVRSTDLGDTFINHVTTEPPTLPLLLEMSKHSGLSLLRATGRSGDDATFEVDPGASQEFFHAVKPIVEAIAFLVHATGSGPLRLSEVVDDRYCNGSSPRNLFIQHGLVFLLRRNLKSSSVRGCRSSVIHFPPVRVAELLIYYLAVIRPVEILLTASLGWTEQHEAYSQFLYVVKGRKLTPSGLSGIIAQHTSQHFGCRLTGLDFRHVLINMQSVFLPPIVDPSVQKFGDSQAGHSSRVANHIYGQRIDHLPGEQAALFVLSHHWCRKLHTFLGLGPETTPIRPLPYLHAPPEPTWWSPSDYIPPQPPSLHEMMRQVQLMINSSLLSAIEELATRCERALREAVFQAAATSSTIAASSNSPFAAQRSPTSLDDFCVLPSTPVDVSFRSATSSSSLISLSCSQNPSLTSVAQHPPPPWHWKMPNSSMSCRSTRDAAGLSSLATTSDDFSSRSSPVSKKASSQSYPPALANQSPFLDQSSPRVQGLPSSSPATLPFVASLPSRHAPSESGTLSGVTGICLPALVVHL